MRATEGQTGPFPWSASLRLPWSLAHELLVTFQCWREPVNAGGVSGWYVNLYKCADDSPHPHWAFAADDKQDIRQRLDFHQPSSFAPLFLARDRPARAAKRARL